MVANKDLVAVVATPNPELDDPQTVKHCGNSIRMLAVSTIPNQMPYQPLRAYMDKKSIQDHVWLWQQILLFIIRMQTNWPWQQQKPGYVITMQQHKTWRQLWQLAMAKPGIHHAADRAADQDANPCDSPDPMDPEEKHADWIQAEREQERAAIEANKDPNTIGNIADKQAGHTPHITGIIYSREITEFEGSTTTRRLKFRASSMDWHWFLGFLERVYPVLGKQVNLWKKQAVDHQAQQRVQLHAMNIEQSQVEAISQELECKAYHSKVLDCTGIIQQFQKGQTRVIAATSALGMGINIPNIQCVIHIGRPRTLLDYRQESRHAGRDRLASEAVIIHPNRWDTQDPWIDGVSEVNFEQVQLYMDVVGGTGCRRYVLDQYLDGTVDGYTRQQCQDVDTGKLPCDRCDPDWEAQEVPVSPTPTRSTTVPTPEPALSPAPVLEELGLSMPEDTIVCNQPGTQAARYPQYSQPTTPGNRLGFIPRYATMRENATSSSHTTTSDEDDSSIRGTVDTRDCLPGFGISISRAVLAIQWVEIWRFWSG
ncbi:hypothetical protein BJX63DRAFT_436795 [Aspergillus granulosus]|uniref:DNA 3'-5' helicase n=1 Tax=Aspergillus granulosus TaxID=176169 RepID=A0ABR4GWZ3_9EURO